MKKKNIKKTNNSFFLLNIFIIGIIFLVLRWNSFMAEPQTDEGAYSYSAWLMTQDMVPYRDSFEHKPPLIIFTYLFSFLFSKTAYWPPRMLAFIFELSTIILVGLVLKKEYSRRTALIAMWLLPAMNSLVYLAPYSVSTEKFALTPLLGALLLYVHKRNKKTSLSWFFFGVLSAVSIYYKPVVLPILFFIYFVWIIENWERFSDKKMWIKNNLLSISGFLLTTLIVFSFFIAKGAMNSVVECIIVFNKYYIESFGFSITHLFRYIKTFFSSWWPLYILLVIYFIKRQKRWWFYGGLFFSCLLTIYSSPLPYYYILLVPFLAIISAITLDSFYSKKKKIQFNLILLAVVITISLPLKKNIFLSPTQLNTLVYGRSHPFIESPIVANRLSQLTDPEDTIFVGGSEPQLLFQSQRKSATRFTNVYPLTLDSPKVIEYQKQAMLDLSKSKPKAIVYSRMAASWQWKPSAPSDFSQHLTKLMKDEYQLTGGFIWEENGGRWQEPIGEEQLSKASLLLFIRNEI